MKRETIIFLLIASLLYPLGMLVISQTVIRLQMAIAFVPIYIFIVGWCASDLEKE